MKAPLFAKFSPKLHPTGFDGSRFAECGKEMFSNWTIILALLCIWMAFPIELVLRSSLVSAKSDAWTIAKNGKASALCYIKLNTIYFFNNLRMIREEKKSVLFSEECSGTILYNLIARLSIKWNCLFVCFRKIDLIET